MTRIPVAAGEDDWSAKTVASAFLIAVLTLVLTVAMSRQGVWPALPWSELAVPALAGAVYLAWKHPKHRIVPFVVFLPVCLFALFLVAPTVAGLLNRIFGST